MPPRKKAASATAVSAKAKTPRKKPAGKVKAEPVSDEDEPPVKLQRKDSKNTQIKKAFENLKKEEKKDKKGTIKVDEYSPFDDLAQVYEDYACMLNQTNIGANNNKFYVIQIVYVKKSQTFNVFTRWGRVGESGQKSNAKFKDAQAAIKEFKKKFKDKTKNDWDDRENFVSQPKKYTLLEIDQDDEEEEQKEDDAEPQGKAIAKKIGKEITPTLDAATLDLIKRIFDEQMFENAMTSFSLDIRKMPLGKLSKTQISKGFDVLVGIEDCLKKPRQDLKKLEQLSSQFYTLIPHAFGRNRPPLISTPFIVNQKKEMLLVLSDIELTQSLQKDALADEEINPWDEKYKLLQCNLSVLPKKSNEYKVIENYLKATACDYYKIKLLNVWEVDRNTEGGRFKNHDNIVERKLLWHGTNMAVVAAILSSGLRIMPHSGGRVGKGIYFASENNKSFSYTCPDVHGVYCMFLNEVALGKEYTITVDDSNLKAAPKGFDSVVARGSTEPDPTKDTKLKLEGKDVIVPQGKPIATKYTTSSFSQSEYLVYKESQVRIRYVVTLSA